MDEPNWAKLESVRNWVNHKTYGHLPRLKPAVFLIEGLAFILVLRVAIYFSYELVFQFVIGTLLLNLLKKQTDLLRRPPRVSLTNISQAVSELALPKPLLGILAESFRGRGSLGQDLPLQENTFLVLALIWIQHKWANPLETDPRWIFVQLTIVALFTALRWRQEKKFNRHSWICANRAIEQRLIAEQTSSLAVKKIA